MAHNKARKQRRKKTTFQLLRNQSLPKMLNFLDRLPVRNDRPYHRTPAKTDDMRIKIRLHHTGLVTRAPLIGQRRQEVEDFLTDIWSQFGCVMKTHYNKEFSSVVVTYRTRVQGFFAMASLRDSIQVAAAIQAAVGADFERSALAKQMFVSKQLHGSLLTPSYDTTKTVRTEGRHITPQFLLHAQ